LWFEAARLVLLAPCAERDPFCLPRGDSRIDETRLALGDVADDIAASVAASQLGNFDANTKRQRLRSRPIGVD
jgi:hypothetical protein